MSKKEEIPINLYTVRGFHHSWFETCQLNSTEHSKSETPVSHLTYQKWCMWIMRYSCIMKHWILYMLW